MSTTTASAIRDLDTFQGIVVSGADAARLELGRLADLRVAVVGAGVDLAPLLGTLARVPAATTVFHTEPAWVLPRVARPGRAARRGLRPSVLRDLDRTATELAASAHLRRHVRDRWTRRQLTPTAPPSRTNVVCSSSYYRALGRVGLVFWPVAGACPEGLRTADGIEHHVDAIVIL